MPGFIQGGIGAARINDSAIGSHTTYSSQKIEQAIEDHGYAVVAPEYSASSTYTADQYCIYEGALYRCIESITVAEPWTAAHWTSTLVVDNFGSGGGASVTLGTSAPLDASGENGDLYVQYEALTYKVVEYFVKINNSWRKSPYSRVVALTQAEYDLITPDTSTLYIITDAQSSYQTKQDSNLQTTADTIVGAINELNTALSNTTISPSFNKVSKVNGVVIRNANTVSIKLVLLATSNISNNDEIISNLPLPDSSDNLRVFLATGTGQWQPTNFTSNACSITTAGSIGIIGAINSGAYIFIDTTYICI